jgi:hypothetical protein
MRIVPSHRKYRLSAGSELLRVGYWQRAEPGQLKGLIKRFATREERARKSGKPVFLWRTRRLKAVAIYEARFESAPAVFRHHKLPSLISYYVSDGRYLWPETGEPGKPVLTR